MIGPTVLSQARPTQYSTLCTYSVTGDHGQFGSAQALAGGGAANCRAPKAITVAINTETFLFKLVLLASENVRANLYSRCRIS